MFGRIWLWIRRLFVKQKIEKQLSPTLEAALFYVEQYEAKKEGKRDVKR